MNTPLSRRGLMKTAVWSAPAITLAAAAPAFATSGDVTVKPPNVHVECVDTPGKHSKTVRLIVRLSPNKAGAVVKIGKQIAKYDKHYGYYVDVAKQPSGPLTILVTWVEKKKAQSLAVVRTFNCDNCGNGKGGK